MPAGPARSVFRWVPRPQPSVRPVGTEGSLSGEEMDRPQGTAVTKVFEVGLPLHDGDDRAEREVDEVRRQDDPPWHHGRREFGREPRSAPTEFGDSRAACLRAPRRRGQEAGPCPVRRYRPPPTCPATTGGPAGGRVGSATGAVSPTHRSVSNGATGRRDRGPGALTDEVEGERCLRKSVYLGTKWREESAHPAAPAHSGARGALWRIDGNRAIHRPGDVPGFVPGIGARDGGFRAGEVQRERIVLDQMPNECSTEQTQDREQRVLALGIDVHRSSRRGVAVNGASRRAVDPSVKCRTTPKKTGVRSVRVSDAFARRSTVSPLICSFPETTRRTTVQGGSERPRVRRPKGRRQHVLGRTC